MQRMMIRRRGARCSGSGAVALNLLRASLTAVPFLASLAPCCADPAPIIHYAKALSEAMDPQGLANLEAAAGNLATQKDKSAAKSNATSSSAASIAQADMVFSPKAKGAELRIRYGNRSARQVF
jgi:hypothetical protein